MVDVAKLKIVADTTDLKRGQRDLQAVSRVGAQTEGQFVRTGRATTRMSSAFRSHNIRNFAQQLNQVSQQAAATGNLTQAISIQLPDMLAAFGTFGIIAGIAAPMVANLGAALIGAGQDAKSLEDRIDDLSDAVTAYQNAAEIAGLSTEELSQRFGSAAGQAQAMLAYLSFSEQQSAISALSSAVNDLEAEFSAIFSNVDRSSHSGRTALQRMERDFNLTKDQALQLRDALSQIGQAETPEDVLTTTVNLKSTLEQIYGSLDQMPTRLREMVDAAAQANVEAARIVGTTERESLIREENLRSAREMVATMIQDANIRAAAAEFGRDSAQVAELRLERERQILDAKLEELGVTGQVKEELIAGAIAALEVALNSESAAAGIAAAAAEATQMANEIQRAVNGMINLRAQGVASLRQSELRLQYRDDPVGLAGAMAGERFDTRSEALRANAPDGQLEYLRQEREAYVANAEATEENRQALIAWQQEQGRAAAGSGGRRPRTSGGGGSRGQSEAERKHQERLREAERIYRSTRTAAEQYASELNDLNELHQLGYLDADAHARATEALSDELGLSAPIAARFAQQIAALNAKLAAGEITNEEYAASLQGLQAQMDNLGDLPTIEQGIQSISDAMAQAIVSGENLGEAFSRVLDQIAADILSSGIKMLLTDLFTPAGGGGGGFLGSLFAGLFDKGGNIPTGKVGIAGENGPELIRGPAHVTSTAATARLLGQRSEASMGHAVLTIEAPEGFSVEQRGEIQNIAVNVTQTGLEHYNRNVAPGRQAQIANDPRRRG